jgi:hypothetical protein
MNTIAAHKGHLQELLDDLSCQRALSRITFVALVNAYIGRLDTESELTYGPDIDSKLRALLRTTQNFKTAGAVFPKDPHCGPQTCAGCLPATAAWGTLGTAGPFPGRWALMNVKHQAKYKEEAKKIESESRTSSQNRSAPNNFRGKPKYLFHGMVK